MAEQYTSFPPELISMVLKNLRPSDEEWHASWPKAKEIREPLNTCTLVSRSWYPLAREHLFRNVVYSFQRPPDESVEAWACPGAQDRWEPCPPGKKQGVKHLPLKTLQMLADFIEQSPAIRSSIRRLRLACYPTLDNDSWPSYWGYNLNKNDDVDSMLLTSLLNSLPRLEEFYPWNIFFTTPFIPTPTTPAPSLRKMEIRYGVGHPTSLKTCKLLTCISTLKELVIIRPSYGSIGIVRDKDKLSEEFPAATPLDVHSLTVSMVWNDPPLHCISALLCRSPSIQNLRRLTLDTLSFEVIPGVETMMRDLGARLEYFKLTLLDCGDAGFYNEVFDLSTMPNLQELVIGLTPELNDTQMRSGLVETGMQYFRTAILSPRVNPHLQKITFCLGYDNRFVGDSDEEDGWWDNPELRSHITGFEEHFAGLVHAFKLPGIFFHCRDDVFPHAHKAPGCLEMLRRMVPMIFQQLSRDGLLIMAE